MIKTNPLSENFLPETFPHREEQIKVIEKVFSQWEQLGHGDNLLLSGATGSGKTSIIKYIMEKHNNVIFSSGKDHNTSRKMFMDLTKEKQRTTCDLVSILIKNLKEEPKILIIDEAQRIKDISNFMDFINSIYRETGFPLIIITNKRGFISSMPEDARFTLFLMRVDFPSYNAVQLKDIISERLGLLGEKTIPEETINYVCAKVVHDFFGSARTSLDLINKCLKNNDFSQQFINKVIYQINEEEVESFISKMSNVEKMFLQEILELSMIKKEMTSRDILEKVKNLSPSRISQLITTFVKDYAILEENYKNYGRKKGRFRIVSFRSEEDKAGFYQALHPELYFSEEYKK